VGESLTDLNALRTELTEYACDDCPWSLIDDLINEVERLREIRKIDTDQARIAPDKGTVVSFPGVRVWVGPSDGSDGAIVVIIDTDFEPDAMDLSSGLRVLLNDEPVYAGVPYAGPPRT
jgi:hypothetical protein